ncbi:MAG TPA: M18 family aminopeptidase, partial [Porticoccaceae bacterium]|nr:M18 family aminopeptidase [Porticoccaceae bacterium]
MLSAVEADLPAAETLRRLLTDTLQIPADGLLGFDLNVYDTQPGAFFGPQREFIANS